MALRHREDVRGPRHEFIGERLAALLGDVDGPRLQRRDGVGAGRLPPTRGDAGGSDLEILAPLGRFPQKALGHRRAADISRADKEDSFLAERHGGAKIWRRRGQVNVGGPARALPRAAGAGISISMKARLLPALLLAAALASLASRAEPVISEFVAKNDSGITDENGARGDWIEIHNPTAATQNMDGWYLTDSAANKTQWRFPAVSIEPGGFLLVWADNKNRRVPGAPLHTNFALNNSGEYLGLIRPDGVTVQQEFAPTYPPQDPDRAYGLIFARTVLLAEAASADYRVPASAAQLAANWHTAATTPAGWTLSKPTGLGFGLTVPGMTVTVRAKNTATGLLNTQSDALLLLSRPSGHADIANESVSVLPVFNVLGEGSDGRYPANQLPPAWALNDYVYRATGTFSLATAAVWTFGLNSDDGGRIVIDGTTVMDDASLHGPLDHTGTVSLAAGSHTFDVFFWERGGGDEGEFYAAQGSFSGWTAAMRLVGDTAGGGLACFTTPAGVSGGAAAIRTNLESAMRDVNASAFARVRFNATAGAYTSLSLLMHYNDGFSAWLNGTPLTGSNAPGALAWNSSATAARTNAQSLTANPFNISAALPSLLGGSNLLAVQGLNVTAADDSFLLLPEIVAATLPAPPTTAYFNSPTPGAINSAPSALGKVATLAFNPPRGVYPNAAVASTPFEVTLSTTTAGATIRYTTDGTVPTETNGATYTAPIAIAQTTTLRAAAFRTGWEASKVSTHTYVLPADVLTQSPTGLPPAPHWPLPDAEGKVHGQRIDYGMDPDIVDSTDDTIGGAAQVESALRAIPSLSIVIPPPDLFDPTTGIYVNANGRGLAWERASSVEWLNDPAGGFQEDCGLRLRGGYSRSSENPKHAFKLYFRSDYGNGKLDFPLFGPAAATSFNQVDVRTAQNYSWSFDGTAQNTFLREEFCRQTQVEMGAPGSHVRYCHLYLNGQYWGLYDFDERTEADFCATYLGGDKLNWDVVKAEQDNGNDYRTGATDGSTAAWELLFTKANPLVAPDDFTRRPLTAADYHDLMGLAPDGTTPNGSPTLLDPDNLIDYMLNIFWTGNFDAATSAFLGDTKANNWFGARDRTGTRGFVFFVHDAEHSLFNTGEDRTGPFNRPITDATTYADKRAWYNPMFLHADLLDVPEYRQRWHNRVQRHLFNGGALSPAACTERVNRFAAVVESAIIAESARWGDAQAATPFTRAHWRTARDYLLQTFIPQRRALVIAQLRADGLYPVVDGVNLTPQGGYITSTSQIDLRTTGPGAIYYTINGADPMLPDGSLHPSALLFTPSSEIRDTLLADGVAGPGATWKYRDPSTDLGASDIVVGHPAWSSANWKHPAFDDTNASLWKSADTELGDGDGDERTVINIGPGGARYPVIYLRRKFTVANPGPYTALELEVKRDDGAIVYLNGREVGRSNMPAGAIGYTYTGLGAGDEVSFFPVLDPRLIPSVLVAGENTIAVAVHQVNATSSDISFDLRLRGVRTVFANPVTLPPGLATVRARARDGADFGPLSEVAFLVDAVPANASNLAVSELHYHPAASSAAEIAAGYNDDTFFEYVELMNIGPQRVDLMGVSFGDGISWTFDARATAPRLLLSGQRIVLAGHRAAFALRHGAGTEVAGQFSGTLDNGGERLALFDAAGAILRDFTYDDIAPWPTTPDGTGPSLVLLAPSSNPDHTIASNWRASFAGGGTPGGKDTLSLAEYLAARDQTDPSADPDRDGLNNFLAYASGHDLRPFLHRSLLTAISTSQYPTLEYTRRRNTEATTFTVQASLDLAAWNIATTLVSLADNADGTETVRVRTNVPLSVQSRQYLRLRLTQP